MHYLCLKSCLDVCQPDTIHFHHINRPHGEWWDRIEPHLNLRPTQPSPFIRQTRKYRESAEGRYILSNRLTYAHHADFLRLEILAREGGIYADMDTLFINPLPKEYFDLQFVMGEEDYRTSDDTGNSINTLCNALIMSVPGSSFVETWYQRMFKVFDGTWNRHSCHEAAVIARQHPEWITVAPRDRFFTFGPNRSGIQGLFEANGLAEDVISLHLWEHLWADPGRNDFSTFNRDKLTPEFVTQSDSNYARLARRFLLNGP